MDPPCAAPVAHHTGCSGLILTCSKNAGVETAAPTEQAWREQKMGWNNCCPRSWVPRGWWHSFQWFCLFESRSHVSQANLELDFELEILLPPPPGGWHYRDVPYVVLVMAPRSSGLLGKYYTQGSTSQFLLCCSPIYASR